MRQFRIGVLILMWAAFFADAGAGDYTAEVDSALDLAANNRGELEKVLSYYSSPDDSLKLKAAFFLIANMEGHGYVTYFMHDTSGARVDFSVLDYPDFDSLQSACRVMEAERGELDFDRDSTLYDIDNIKSGFLIDQIDYAFKAWNEKPWARGFSFDAFCRYILPYRGSNEPLEEWRKPFWEKYGDIQSKMSDRTDPVEAASLINDDIMTWFKFDPRYYYHPTDQGFLEMSEHRLGRCEDMTNLAIYAMRANGLAVTSDYTPFWANSGNNHAWNAIATPDGRVLPFMGAESDPGVYRLSNKLAKVYRKTFDRQPDNLIFLKRKQKEVPRWLGGKNYVDVTGSYTGVCDVTVKFSRTIPDSVDIAYLCVFNSGEWQAIHWGRINGDSAVFTDMGDDGIVYLPALYLSEEIVPWGDPFILRNDCSETILKKNAGETSSIKVVSTTRRGQNESTDGIEKSFLTPGKTYELFYWDDGWQSGGETVAEEKPIIFGGLPRGCLYWLVEDGSDREERIFTLENGLQVWW